MFWRPKGLVQGHMAGGWQHSGKNSELSGSRGHPLYRATQRMKISKDFHGLDSIQWGSRQRLSKLLKNVLIHGVMQRSGWIILKRLQVWEQKGHKLNGRVAGLLGQPGAALAAPVRIEDGNNSLGARGRDHRTSLLCDQAWERRFQQDSVSFYYSQRFGKPGLRRNSWKERGSGRVAAVFGYWQLSHLEELTLFWVSLESVIQDQNGSARNTCFGINNRKTISNNWDLRTQKGLFCRFINLLSSQRT